MGIVRVLKNFKKDKSYFLREIGHMKISSQMGWRFFAIVLMILPVALSLITWTGIVEKRKWFVFSETVPITVDISPGFSSMLFSCAVFFVLVLRQTFRIPYSRKTDYLIVVLDLLFIASFVSALLSKNEIPGLGVSPQSLLIGAFLFSVFGLRSLSGWAIVVVLLFSLGSVCDVTVCMGVFGAVYVLSGFLSLMIQVFKLNYCSIGLSTDSILNDFRGVQMILQNEIPKKDSIDCEVSEPVSDAVLKPVDDKNSENGVKL